MIALAAIIPADPGTSVFATAAEWVVGVLTGSVATTVAVIAIAWLGFGMLAGRIDWRRGGRVLLGCFILFGAAIIARGLVGLASYERPMLAALPTASPSAPPVPRAVDPYAGASVPLAN